MEHANHVIIGGRITKMPSTRSHRAEKLGISFDLAHLSSYDEGDILEVEVECHIPAGEVARHVATCFERGVRRFRARPSLHR